MYDLNQIPYDSTVEVRDRFKGLDSQRAWWTMDWGSRHCTGDGSRPFPRKKNAKGKMVVWGGLTNNCWKEEKWKAKKKRKDIPIWMHNSKE